MDRVLDWSIPALPDDRPRHMLGIGEPEDLFRCVERGIDTFDCVAPTRHARRGVLLTADGPLTITKAAYREDDGPVDPELRLPDLHDVHAGVPAAPVRRRGAAGVHAGHHPQPGVHPGPDGPNQSRPGGRLDFATLKADVLGTVRTARDGQGYSRSGRWRDDRRQHYSPVWPSVISRMKSAWPLWRAVSSIMWIRIQRSVRALGVRATASSESVSATMRRDSATSAR